MNDEKKIFIKNYLHKADETLIDAQINIDHNRLNAAQNRIYYAIFYSVVALGYLHGFISAKHKQLMGWFNKKFIHESKVFDSTLFEIYSDAYKNRMQADYTALSSSSKAEVKESLEAAKNFVEKISDHVNKLLP